MLTATSAAATYTSSKVTSDLRCGCTLAFSGSRMSMVVSSISDGIVLGQVDMHRHLRFCRRDLADDHFPA